MISIVNYIQQLITCKRNLLSLNESIDQYLNIHQVHENAVSLKALGVTTDLYAKKPIIVSLTSYGVRLQKAYLAVESLLSQSFKPNKIVLSLSHDIKYDDIPVLLKNQEKRGLELNFCKDLRSFTKLIPVLKKYPDSIIITIDDDMIYPYDFVEYLVKAYIEDPSKIYFYYGYKMSVDKYKNPLPYLKWCESPAVDSSLLNLPTGVDGILYPPECFFEDVTKDELFLKLCPHEDDLWFKVMTMLKGCECKYVPRALNPRKEFIPLPTSFVSSLRSINSVRDNSDKQFMNLYKYYNLQKYF